MNIVVVINKSGGSVIKNQIDTQKIQDLFYKYKVNSDVYIESCDEIKNIVKKAIEDKVEIIIAGGGDGTISLVAELIIDTDIILGVLPLGTLNHFAKDIGMPDDIEESIKIICQKHILPVDVGQVNGKIFINNSSIGLYPQMVKYRLQAQNKLRLGKWTAMLIASIRTAVYIPKFSIELHLNDHKVKFRTPFVFIGNNEYSMNIFKPAKRESLTDGKLSLYTYTHTSRYNIIKLGLSFIFNKLNQEKYFGSLLVEEVIIKAKKKRISVSLDGEITYMQSPLAYKILPKKLKVICPK